jgi:sugar transferase EpsL
MRQFELAVKRGFDLMIASTLLVLAAPVLAGLWVAIRFRMGSPVLFTQWRGGEGNNPFLFYKFRSMTDERDPLTGDLAPDHIRLTAFGRWLRNTSLDELPQLWNVVRGDMSLIGPRPLLAEYLPLYGERELRRHLVRPGITGWAQVNGRNALSWTEKFELDLWYVDHWSLGLDCRILGRTIAVALGQSGINQRAEVTMPKFTGTSGMNEIEQHSNN